MQSGIKHKKIFDYRQGGQNFQMNQEELPDQRIKVVIRLSSSRNIDTIKDSLKQNLKDFKCKERGNVIAVSGYPPSNDFDASNVLAIVQKHDPNAVQN